MCRECSRFIDKNSKIIDLGCGSGIVGKKFSDFFQSEVTGLDIVDLRVENIPFKLYDGNSIPFPDNYFDVALINYVLHHCENPIYVLREGGRVAKDKIIIYEDIPEGFFSRLFCRLHGMTFAKIIQKNEARGNFKTTHAWKQIFQKLGLKLIFEKKVQSIFATRKLFVLKK